jgi:GH15 family glucan-1,4-alpha-glucosidase
MHDEGRGGLDLAVVGNCEVAALIDMLGRIVWMCLPRADGDPVFSALLTRAGGASNRGTFAVDLIDCAQAQQQYLRNTAILETTLADVRGAAVRITDFCPRFRARGRMFRPMMLIRVVEPVAGRPLLRIRLRPTAGHGARSEAGGAGSHHLRFAAEGVTYRITTDASIAALAEDRTLVLEHPLTFILGPDSTIEETPAVLAQGFLRETCDYWRDWVRTLAVPFDYQTDVIRAAITLKLCTFEDTGAVLNALTTSIPEGPGDGRTWDCRYCWLRDGRPIVQALSRLGATRTMEGYLNYIDGVVAGSGVAGLQPVYGITGAPQIAERRIQTLEGYAGAGPVRIGNQAAEQTQHDVYGSVVLALSQLFFDERLAQPGDASLFSRLEPLGDRAAAVYELPDAGPWEMRGRMRSYTFSAAVSWAACDRLARIAARLGLHARARRWLVCAQAMRDRVLARAWNEQRHAFTGTLGGEELDATVLLLPELGLLPATDPRFLATLELIGRELRAGELLFRYRHADDSGTPQTAFTLCGLWYADALAAAGRGDEARERFGRLLGRRSRFGLLSATIDPATGNLWGNLPQTPSLAGIINCGLRLTRSWEEAL